VIHPFRITGEGANAAASGVQSSHPRSLPVRQRSNGYHKRANGPEFSGRETIADRCNSMPRIRPTILSSSHFGNEYENGGSDQNEAETNERYFDEALTIVFIHDQMPRAWVLTLHSLLTNHDGFKIASDCRSVFLLSKSLKSFGPMARPVEAGYFLDAGSDLMFHGKRL
jgi:hypothetical protein